MATILKDYLSPYDIKNLLACYKIHDHTDGWESGRLDTGYYKFDLKKSQFFNTYNKELLERTLCVLGTSALHEHDIYFIRYLAHSYTPPHKDPSPVNGKRHVRLNAILQKPHWGGDLFINKQKIDLNIGDAVLFYPDEEEHEVTKCISSYDNPGERLLFSVGALI